jgi:hypothetical protein
MQAGGEADCRHTLDLTEHEKPRPRRMIAIHCHPGFGRLRGDAQQSTIVLFTF